MLNRELSGQKTEVVVVAVVAEVCKSGLIMLIFPTKKALHMEGAVLHLGDEYCHTAFTCSCKESGMSLFCGFKKNVVNIAEMFKPVKMKLNVTI